MSVQNANNELEKRHGHNRWSDISIYDTQCGLDDGCYLRKARGTIYNWPRFRHTQPSVA